MGKTGKVLVTGATGFLGSALCRALHAEGLGLIATGRNKAACEALRASRIETLECDLADRPTQAVADTLAGVQTIVHCAALSSPWGTREAFHRANVRATKNLVEIAETIGAKRFILVSTPSVYFRFTDQENVLETAELPPPVNDYAATKRMAEQVVQSAANIRSIIVRPRGIYGAGDTALLPRLARLARKSPLPRFNDGIGATDITHVDDVVSFVMRAIEQPVSSISEIFNVSGGETLPLPAIIEAACNAMDVDLRWRNLPFRPLLAAARLTEGIARRLPNQPEPPVTAYGLGILRYTQTLNIEKANALLGWQPKVSFEEGLRRTFEQGVQRALP